MQCNCLLCVLVFVSVWFAIRWADFQTIARHDTVPKPQATYHTEITSCAKPLFCVQLCLCIVVTTCAS